MQPDGTEPLGTRTRQKAQRKLIISYTRQEELLSLHSLPHQGYMTLRGETKLTLLSKA